ncbi:MAG: nucleotidyltransferase domain-containing protein, partial [Gaiellaceae bacterium]
GDVLAVLSRADATLTGAQVHRLVGHSSDEGVRKALERLVRQGIVERQAAGAAYLYFLNREHLAARWVEGLAGLSRQLVERLRENLESWRPKPAVALLFGSVARGEATQDSDLDLLLIRPDSVDGDDLTWRGQVLELQRAATAWTGNEARVIEYAEQELADLAGKELVLEQAATEGIELVGSLRVFRRALRRSS